jgi:hypothetical protein
MSSRMLALICLSLPSMAYAQLDLPAPSPKARAEQRVGLTDFSIDYSSPGVKGRKIWGDLVPLDKPWRTGANAATKLTASKDFMLGDKAVKAGSYALYTVPGKTSWTVILNSSSENWGTNGYDQTKNVATIQVKPQTMPASRERMTFIFSNTTDGSTQLDMEWEKIRLPIPISVDTKAQVATNIDNALTGLWRTHFAAARYQLDSNGDLDKAMTWIDQSIAIKPHWWNNWVRAQILAKKGKSADAVAAATKAQELGKGDNTYENFFKTEIEKSIGDWQKKKS